MTHSKILYSQFLENKSIYNLNVSYWRVKLQQALKEKISSEEQLVKNKNEEGKNFYDGNPIFSFYSSKREKAIRIIQENPLLIGSHSDIKLIEAWIDKVFVADTKHSRNEYSEVEVPELVISLFLTSITVDKCVKIAEDWFKGDVTKANLEHKLMQCK